MLNLILLSFMAGVVGTGAGGAIGAFLGKRSESILCIVLSFAAGVMISIVTFSLIPEAVELSNTGNAILGIVTGIFVLMIMDKIVDSITDKNKQAIAHTHTVDATARSKSLYRAGFVMLGAIALHNLPEGIAIGSSGAHNISLSIGLAALLMLHNVPVGMAISAPLIGGGMRRSMAISLAALSGTTTVLGAALGFWLGGISPMITAFCIAAASGAMLYVVFGEIIPQSLAMQKNRFPTYILLFGIICGLFLTSLV